MVSADRIIVIFLGHLSAMKVGEGDFANFKTGFIFIF
jgi:hypothetical protein